MIRSGLKRKIILIRHAQSMFNMAACEAEKETEQACYHQKQKEINCRYDLIDCCITPEGLEQVIFILIQAFIDPILG